MNGLLKCLLFLALVWSGWMFVGSQTAEAARWSVHVRGHPHFHGHSIYRYRGPRYHYGWVPPVVPAPVYRVPVVVPRPYGVYYGPVCPAPPVTHYYVW